MSSAQPEPEKIPLQQLFRIVDRLSPAERIVLRQRLNKDTLAEWQALSDRVRERNKNLPSLSEEEIVAALNEEE
jgi:hypothetical protein